MPDEQQHASPPEDDLLGLVEDLPDLVQALRPDGSIAFANRAYRELLGYSLDEIQHLRFTDVIAPQEIDHCMMVFQQLQTGAGAGKIRTIFQSKTGEAYLVEAHVTPRARGDEVIGTTMVARVHSEEMPGLGTLETPKGWSTSAEERLRALIQEAPVGIAITSASGIVEVNPALERILGYSSTDYREIGLLAAIPEEDREEVAKAFQALVESGDDSPSQPTRDFRCISRDGAEVWLRSTPAVIRDLSGRFRYAINVLQDVTDERRMIAALEEREQRFRAIFDHSPVGIALQDGNRAILSVNAAFAGMVKMEPAEIIGKRIGDLRAPSSPPGGQHMFEAMVAGEIPSFTGELTLQASDGTEVHVDSLQAAVRDEGGEFRFGVRMLVDVTARVRSEEALAESEAYVAQILATSPLGIVVVDAGALITDVNPAFERMTGHTARDLEGRSLSELIPPDVVRPNEGRHSRQVAGELDIISYERPFLRTDGTRFVGRITSAPMRAPDGTFLRSVRLIEDVTEEREIERLKDEFLAVVSHELRTPLASLTGSLGLLAQGALEATSEMGQQMLEVAERNAHRLAGMITDILDMERLLTGKLSMEMSDWSVASLVSDAVEVAGPMAEEAAIRIEQDVADATIQADGLRIVQTLTNLLTNAVKFSPEGGTVKITAARDGDIARFSVEDHGEGIPEGFHGSIFERFYQVDSDDRRAHGGAGLGLALCKEIVGAHGGRIWVESQPGTGSRFTFEIPVEQQPAN